MRRFREDAEVVVVVMVIAVLVVVALVVDRWKGGA